jgi:peptidoglycan/LPS O-acetylase OafA/YrhL
VDGRERFTVLDGMRGLAAVVIITDHVTADALTALLPGRYLAVDFFFALSGFVLAHVYEARLRAGLSVTAFVRRRLLRLYPLYAAALAAGVILALWKVVAGREAASFDQLWLSAILNSLYLPALPAVSVHADEPFPFNGPAWSLFFELIANAAFALVVIRLTNYVLASVVVLAAVGVAGTALAFGQLDPGWLWSNFWGGFTRVGYAFFAGVLVFRLRSSSRAPALPVPIAFAVLLAVFCLPASGVWRPIWDAFAATIVFPVLIAGAANSEASAPVARLCSLAGTLSYGFYVLQVPVRDWTYAVLSHTGVHLPGLVLVALVAGLTLVVASLLHVWYDVPVRRFLLRRSPAP